MVVKSVSLQQYNKLKRWYEEELASKDKQIAELHSQNQAVLRSALSQAQRTREWEQIARNVEARENTASTHLDQRHKRLASRKKR